MDKFTYLFLQYFSNRRVLTAGQATDGVVNSVILKTISQWDLHKGFNDGFSKILIF